MLPKEIEDIILDYVEQLELTERYSKVLEEIKNIDYRIDSFRYYGLGRRYSTQRNRVSFSERKVSDRVYKNNYVRYIYDNHKNPTKSILVISKDYKICSLK